MKISETAKLFHTKDNFLLLTHKNPDGDTLGSAAALCSALRRAGKTAFLFPNAEMTEKYRSYAEPFHAPEGFEPSFTVAVDVASETLFPPCFSGEVDFCIDHHPSNTHYAPKSLIAPSKASCGEVVLQLIKALNGDLSEEEADLLYVAVSTDCGCFVYANTKADTLRAAAELLDFGADNQTLNVKLFRKVSRARMKIEGMVYSGMEFYRDGRISLATITQRMLLEAGATEEDLDDISGLAGRAEGAILSITVREQSDGSTRFSLRSSPEVDCSAICSVFGGGGHAMAAGCTIHSPVEKAKRMMLDVIDEVWK
ncbi:MAG: DHH family phosphoesterase [Oscillospiraceae bacterium]|nr:DHH family phosphoesterase [Oscillospiraceae bacterium]